MRRNDILCYGLGSHSRFSMQERGIHDPPAEAAAGYMGRKRLGRECSLRSSVFGSKSFAICLILECGFEVGEDSVQRKLFLTPFSCHSRNGWR